jgi:proline iminopeptidase
MATSTLPRVRPAPASRTNLGPRVSVGLALAAGIGAAAGLIVGFTLPRGPITAWQTIALMLFGLTVGGVTGFVARSRWAMLLAPMGFLTAFEIGRRGLASGPSVDTVRLEMFYGVLAIVLGHVVLVIAGVLPMVVGASLGVAFGRRTSTPGLSVLALIGLVALGVVALQPASTPPILAPDGRPLAGSIANLEPVQLGGHEQWIMLRGHDTSKPVLLYLSGGPGQSDLPFVRVLFQNLESDFVVVGWDQRDTGKSYPALEPTAALTLDQTISDTIELSEYLRARFDEPKIYMIGESWGSTLGVLAAQRRPDLYYAVIGSGQMVSQRETDRRLYYDVLALAERTNDANLARAMRRFGEPPYGDVFASGFVMPLTTCSTARPS